MNDKEKKQLLSKTINFLKAYSKRWDKSAVELILNKVSNGEVKKFPKLVNIAIQSFEQGFTGKDELLDVDQIIRSWLNKKLKLDNIEKIFANKNFTSKEINRLNNASNPQIAFENLIDSKYKRISTRIKIIQKQIDDEIININSNLKVREAEFMDYESFSRLTIENKMKLLEDIEKQYNQFFRNKTARKDYIEENIDIRDTDESGRFSSREKIGVDENNNPIFKVSESSLFEEIEHSFDKLKENFGIRKKVLNKYSIHGLKKELKENGVNVKALSQKELVSLNNKRLQKTGVPFNYTQEYGKNTLTTKDFNAIAKKDKIDKNWKKAANITKIATRSHKNVSQNVITAVKKKKNNKK